MKAGSTFAAAVAALTAVGSLISAARATDLTAWHAVERGRYLVTVGNCAECHSQQGDAPLAGGRAIPTPFGVIYSPNITPDKDTGIGGWSENDFWNAMHNGVDPQGRDYYPAFPYPNFTKMTREDVDAIQTYLATLKPVRHQNRPSAFIWPLNYRFMMIGWNRLFFQPGTYQANSTKSTAWNRGAYLVTGPAHCDACHTPRNFLGAEKTDAAFRGGYGENWLAPNLTDDKRVGLGRWSQDDIIQYLKTGTNQYATASGPMAGVITASTQFFTRDDLQAVATYLADLPGAGGEGTATSASSKAAQEGAAIYVDNCTGCHMEHGEGVVGAFPPLANNQLVQQDDPTNVVRAVIKGDRGAATAAQPTGLAMPAFGWKLKDDEVAALVTFLRSNFGNQASAVSASEVASVRKQKEDE